LKQLPDSLHVVGEVKGLVLKVRPAGERRCGRNSEEKRGGCPREGREAIAPRERRSFCHRDGASFSARRSSSARDSSIPEILKTEARGINTALYHAHLRFDRGRNQNKQEIKRKQTAC
jgi:hypothetical protein